MYVNLCNFIPLNFNSYKIKHFFANFAFCWIMCNLNNIIIMKKIFVLISAALLSCCIAVAQDMETATNLAKEANEALMGGDFKAAIEKFKAAVEAVGDSAEESAAELVASCKTGQVQAQNAYSQSLYKSGNLEGAISEAEATIALASEYGEDAIKEKAEKFKTQLHQAIAGAKIKAASAEKDPAAKGAAYKAALDHLDSVLASEPENGNAFLQKGQVFNALGQKDNAIEAFLKAKEFGKADQANKQLSNLYLKSAQALNKAGKFKEAVAEALKSAEALPNANAYKIAGIASQKAGDIASAAAYLEKYLEISPNAADAPQMKAAVDAFKAQLKK